MHDFWSRVFDAPDLNGAFVIAGRTAAVFLVLVAGLRLLGKRELGQMAIHDLVLVVVIGNAVQNAMVGHDTTLVGGLIAVAVLLVFNRALAELIGRSRRVEHVLVGEPVVLVSNGATVAAHLTREGITVDQVFAAMREHGIEWLGAVRLAVLEVDGTISVVPTEATVYRTRRHFKGLRLP